MISTPKYTVNSAGWSNWLLITTSYIATCHMAFFIRYSSEFDSTAINNPNMSHKDVHYSSYVAPVSLDIVTARLTLFDECFSLGAKGVGYSSNQFQKVGLRLK